VLKQAAHHRTYCDVVAQARHARTQGTHTPHNQVNFYPGLGSRIQFIDHVRLQQGIHASHNSAFFTGLGQFRFFSHSDHHIAVQIEW